MKMDAILQAVKWDKNGLAPCVAQDAKDGTILMVAYMNEESLRKTILDKKACYFSRSRQKLWLKGEESGNVQHVKKIAIDCDGDCILIQVEQAGGAACHTGMRSCFYREMDEEGNLIQKGKQVFDPKKVYK
ncbi:MAG: phosphoribosyl-AMP cyclohydrolase [Elusimicrobia bacterium]|nr:phosphoribosyl-AMP cyclohydrolase [Elusimicrobiota bacterium]